MAAHGGIGQDKGGGNVDSDGGSEDLTDQMENPTGQMEDLTPRERSDAQDKGGRKVDSDGGLDAQDKGRTELDVEEAQELESLLEFYDNTRDKNISITDGSFSLIVDCLFFSERRESTLRLCIPNELVDDVLHLCHNSRAHPGVRRTYSSVSLRFFFPRMSRRIKRHVDDCLECQTSKPSHEKPPGQLHPIPAQSPHHSLCMDFITGLPESHGYNALLTVTDAYTKAIRLIPCRNTTTAEETA